MPLSWVTNDPQAAAELKAADAALEAARVAARDTAARVVSGGKSIVYPTMTGPQKG